MVKIKKSINPNEQLVLQLTALLNKVDCYDIPNDLPCKWERHGDLILLPNWSFTHKIWSSLGDKLWDVVTSSLKCERIARKSRVKNDDFRSPCVEILRGHNGWVLQNDNKIKYTYDVTKCMFSAGNISEKLRIANLSCEGETVVDMYAGIGYFTLPFLIHAKAREVHACEWNPHSVEALCKSLTLNGIRHKCKIYYGDNKEICPKKIADRVNLGLIPSSEKGWRTACEALKPSGGTLHVHGTVTVGITKDSKRSISNNDAQTKIEWQTWGEYVCRTIQLHLKEIYGFVWNVECKNILRIKSYAPHVDHLVIDVECYHE